MKANVRWHLAEIARLSHVEPNSFTPIGEILSNVISIVSMQEERISALEIEIAEQLKK